ncbi:MAG: hypothetical protein HXS41_14845 [Theionarchaea archaeon]|nr:hypothetical protein [Theionarchaea archaeon]MBU6999421.1 hypothetical protein [Theionarchaea archaeon]MBU7022328.1 hypothetical protein [Theionarchaea archaeon]MBU7036025.1 hypothetical protein [Theionarchaea archaeon]
MKILTIETASCFFVVTMPSTGDIYGMKHRNAPESSVQHDSRHIGGKREDDY